MDANRDWNRFLEATRKLFKLHDKAGDRELVEIYFAALMDLTVEQVEEAVAKAVLSLKYFPKPAELRELATGRQAASASSLEDQAEIATGVAYEHIGRVGRYRSVCFDDPAIHCVIEGLGGWARFCDSKDDNYSRKSFARSYVAHAKRLAREGLDGVRKVLYGEHGEPTPKYIGKREKIQEWHLIADGGRKQIEGGA